MIEVREPANNTLNEGELNYVGKRRLLFGLGALLMKLYSGGAQSFGDVLVHGEFL